MIYWKRIGDVLGDFGAHRVHFGSEIGTPKLHKIRYRIIRVVRIYRIERLWGPYDPSLCSCIPRNVVTAYRKTLRNVVPAYRGTVLLRNVKLMQHHIQQPRQQCGNEPCLLHYQMTFFWYKDQSRIPPTQKHRVHMNAISPPAAIALTRQVYNCVLGNDLKKSQLVKWVLLRLHREMAVDSLLGLLKSAKKLGPHNCPEQRKM